MSTTATEHADANLNGTKTIKQVRDLLEAGSITDPESREAALKAVYDPDLGEDGDFVKIVKIPFSALTGANADVNNLITVQAISGGVATKKNGILAADSTGKNANGKQHRRLTTLHRASLPTSTQTSQTPVSASMVFTLSAANGVFSSGANETLTLTAARADSYGVTDGEPGTVLADLLGLEGAADGTNSLGADGFDKMREIDIKVDSVAVTANTKKLKAKWTPELGQDLNAYHNLDAEVELTSILSEQGALEIDQEIL